MARTQNGDGTWSRCAYGERECFEDENFMLVVRPLPRSVLRCFFGGARLSGARASAESLEERKSTHRDAARRRGCSIHVQPRARHQRLAVLHLLRGGALFGALFFFRFGSALFSFSKVDKERESVRTQPPSRERASARAVNCCSRVALCEPEREPPRARTRQ